MKIYFLAKNFPAPNCYDPPRSVFDKYQRIRCKCNPYIVALPSFNQTIQVSLQNMISIVRYYIFYTRIIDVSIFKRFEYGFQSETPGPGAYEIANRLFCFGSILSAPFGSFGTRFQKLGVIITPGNVVWIIIKLRFFKKLYL